MTARDHSAHDQNRANPKHAAGITRRTFLAGSAASAALFFLSPVWETEHRCAYAVGEDQSGEIVLLVVSLNDVGFKVVDVTDNADTPKAGVTVTLKASDGATATGVTDSEGAVVIDISNVSTEVDYGEEGMRKRFEGEVTVDAGDGYRVFSAGRLRADGGTAVQVPTRRTSWPGEPYFERIGFDGWDVMYTENQFFSALSNTEPHTVSGILHAPGTSRVEIKLNALDSESGAINTLDEGTFDVVDGRASFSFKGAFLSTASPKVFPVDRSIAVSYSVVNSLDWGWCDTKMSVVKAPLDEVYSPDSGLEKALGTVANGLSYTLPDSWPRPLGGSTLSLDLPLMPVIIAASPPGVVILGVGGKPALKLKDKATFLKKDDWKRESSKSIKGQCKKIVDDAKEDIQKYRDMKTGLKPDGSAMTKYDFSHEFEFNVAIQAYGVMQYLYGSSLWRGTGGLILQMSLSGSFTASAVVGPVPVFIKLGASAAAKLAGQIGMISRGLFSDWNFDYTQTQISGTITIELEVIAGVGISGLASIGLRGAGYLSYYMGFEAAHADRPLPHHVIAGGIEVDVVLQVVIFKWSGKLWGIDDPSLYNSWSDNAEGVQSAGTPVSTTSVFAFGSAASGATQYSLPGMLGSSGVTFDQFAESASIVTEEELRLTAEFKAVKSAANAASQIELSEFEMQTQASGADGGDVVSAWELTGLSSESDVVADGFEYSYVGAAPVNAGFSVGVSGVGADGGVRPTLDALIAQDVFSDPRQKLVVYKGVPYLFRILSVDYGDDGVRSRLAAQRFDLGSGAAQPPVVLEFPVNVRDSYKKGSTTIDRIDMFDYDFDVLVNEADSNTLGEGIYVLLSGGKRPEGDSSTLTQVLANPVMTFLRIDESLKVRDVVSWSDATEKHEYWSFTLPRLFKMTVESAGTNHDALAVVYVRRYGDTPEDVSPADPQGPGCGVYVHVWAGNTLYGELGYPVNNATYDMCGAALDEAGWFYVVSRAKGSGANVTLTSITSVHVGKYVPFAGRVIKNLVDDPGVEDGVPWPGHGGLLTLQGGILQASTFDPKAAGGGLTSRQVGPSDYQMASFRVSPSGDTLVFAQNTEGKTGQEFDESGNPTGAVTEKKYRMMGSVCVNNLFSTPFPVAEMDHPVDSLSNISSGSDGMSYAFAYSSIKDMATSKADVRFASVPATVTATPLSLVSDRLSVLAGAEEKFTMTLRNDGNVILKGCTVEFRDRETGGLIERKERFSLVKENAVASVWTPELYETTGVTGSEDAAETPRYPDEAIAAAGVEGVHILADPLSEGALLPGCTVTYQISFTIPEDWRGTKRTYIVLKDYDYFVPGTRLAAGEGQVLQFSLPHDQCPTCDLDVHREVEAFDPDLGDSLMQSGTDGGADGGTNGSADGGADAPSGQRAVVDMAKTGDKAGLTMAGLVATAAIAGMTAYTARRLANESTGEEGGDGPSE